MKNWKLALLLTGILLLVVSFVIYLARISSCYPSANVWAQYSPDYKTGLMETCKFKSSLFIQFSLFLYLFVPGIILFSGYWLIRNPAVKSRRNRMLVAFILLFLFYSLFLMVYGMLEYPAPGIIGSPWVVETIGILGFLCYLSTLAIWHWKRWGLMLFQGASVALAVLILLGGQSPILAGVILAGVVGLSLLLRPVRHKMV